MGLCKFCNREINNPGSLKSHEMCCNLNPNKIKHFHSPSAGLKPGHKAWNKGLTAKTDERVAKGRNKFIEKMKLGLVNPPSTKGLTMRNESKLRLSESRKKKWASGEYSVSSGQGRGLSSYFKIKDKLFFLRSSYEFIYALYLSIKNIDFDYENIRITFNNKTYINDFYLKDKNTVVEIFGYKDNKHKIEEEIFSKKYNYLEIDGSLIDKYRKEIKNYIDIDFYISKIREGNKSKNYYLFDFDKESGQDGNAAVC